MEEEKYLQEAVAKKVKQYYKEKENWSESLKLDQHVHLYSEIARNRLIIDELLKFIKRLIK